MAGEMPGTRIRATAEATYPAVGIAAGYPLVGAREWEVIGGVGQIVTNVAICAAKSFDVAVKFGALGSAEFHVLGFGAGVESNLLALGVDRGGVFVQQNAGASLGIGPFLQARTEEDLRLTAVPLIQLIQLDAIKALRLSLQGVLMLTT